MARNPYGSQRQGRVEVTVRVMPELVEVLEKALADIEEPSDRASFDLTACLEHGIRSMLPRINRWKDKQAEYRRLSGRWGKP